jgi:hypothetical protein
MKHNGHKAVAITGKQIEAGESNSGQTQTSHPGFKPFPSPRYLSR